MARLDWGSRGLGRIARTTPDWAATTVRPYGQYYLGTFDNNRAVSTGWAPTDRYFTSGVHDPLLVPDILGSNWGISFWFKHTINPWNGTIEYPVIALDSTSLGFSAVRFSVQFGSAGAGGLYTVTVDNGPTVQSVAVQANDWHHIAITCDTGQTELYIDGVAVGAPAPPSAGTGTTVQLLWNAPNALVATEITAVNVCIDSLAFFGTTWLDVGKVGILYNSGVPLQRSVMVADPQCTAYYPCEQPTGALIPTQLRTAMGNAASLRWSQSYTDTYAPVFSTAGVLGAPEESTYTRLADRFKIWNAAAVSLDSRFALGAHKRIDTVAPGLLPYPQPGWGIDTTGYASWFGTKDAPLATPLLTVSSALLQSDPTTNPVVNGVGSLQYVTDRRTCYIRKPVFVSGS